MAAYAAFASYLMHRPSRWRRAWAIAACVALLSGCADRATEAVETPVTEPVAVEVAPAEEAQPVEPPSAREQILAGFGRSEPYAGKLQSLADINVSDARLERLLPPLKYPWAFVFSGDQEILLTLHGGTLLRIDLRTGAQTEIRGLPAIGGGFPQIGLMDIALHPDYANNNRVYFSYAAPNPEADTYHRTEVATAILRGDELTELQPLLNAGDYGWASSNFGGALAFDDAGYLYISIGDRGEDPLTQRGDRLEGKILRVHDDGTVPQDNPFVATDGYDPRIFALGVRNPQGLHYDGESGLLFEAEHGPRGGDEVNILRAGANYGYPVISYGANYATGKPIGEGTHKDGLEQPIFYFKPSIAASRVVMYRGEMFPELDGNLLVAALKHEHIAKLDFDAGVIRSHRPILSEVGGRIRDLKVGADGSLYILSQTTGLHRLYRPPPEPPAPAPEPQGGAAVQAPVAPAAPPPPTPHPGKEYYDIVCSGCHDTGATGAPVIGDYARWEPIMAQPLELTKKRVLRGYNAMPERGLCHSCSDWGLMQMVDYMFTRARENKPE